MSLEILHSTITFILIFTTLYSYGLLITEKFNFKFFDDIFFKILIGYTFVGTLTLIIHFFFHIGNFFSIFILISGLFIFFYFFNKKIKQEFFIFLLILIIISIILFAYSDHPIDSNMYHHPYISYLKSEKIIFAIANIQFRFGHISFLQYVQAAYTNDYQHNISFASINIIFYLSFIFFISKKILSEKNFNYAFLGSVLISCFLLIKYARYREYGNDLIPLLICFYFLILILQEIEKKTYISKFSINLIFPFFVLIFMHKISYSFSFLIFLIIINFKKNLFKNFNPQIFFICFGILFLWLLKNYITTSCFAYPLELSCFQNSYFNLIGNADPSKAAWLTTIWSKGFIDHPNWKNLDLEHFNTSLNWVPTWLSGHFIKILEIVAPLFFIIFLTTIYLYYKRKKINNRNKISSKIKQKFFLLLILILIGLSVWFFKAPIFRYGAFYIVSFIIVSFLIVLSYFFNFKNLDNNNFFKNILFICIIFFVAKNCIRIVESNNNFFPQTFSKLNIDKHTTKEMNGLTLFKSPGVSCFYTKFICSHEMPENIIVGKFKNYYYISIN